MPGKGGPKRGTSRDRSLCVAYVRVSTDDQALGVEAQRAAILRWAAATGRRIWGWWEDQGVSGSVEPMARPALRSLLDRLGEHQAGVVVVAKRDRLARDVLGAALVERLCSRAGLELLSAAGEGEGSDPAAQLQRRMVDAFAEYERELIRQRTKAALARKRARGERAGAVPWGFELAEGGRLAPCEAERVIAALALELREEGLSIRAIVAELARRGIVGRSGRPLVKAAVERLVSGRSRSW